MQLVQIRGHGHCVLGYRVRSEDDDINGPAQVPGQDAGGGLAGHNGSNNLEFVGPSQ